MYCDNLTPEICIAINNEINSLFAKVGLWWFIALCLLVLILYFLIKDHLSKKFEGYKSDLEKSSVKNIELWKQQKELMFNFVKFLEERFFNNSDLKETDPEKLKKTKDKIFTEFNTYYGQLYLVMETSVLEKVNQYINGPTSPVQRYYLYKELRRQLMSIMHQKLDEKDYPFINGDSTKVWVFREELGQQKKMLSKDIGEVKKAYPFIEESSGGSYKTIPFFSEAE